MSSSGSVACKFSPAATVILCSSSLVVPSCMQAVEGAQSKVLTATLRGAVEQDAVEQEEMVAMKSVPSDKSSKSS